MKSQISNLKSVLLSLLTLRLCVSAVNAQLPTSNIPPQTTTVMVNSTGAVVAPGNFWSANNNGSQFTNLNLQPNLIAGSATYTNDPAFDINDYAFPIAPNAPYVALITNTNNEISDSSFVYVVNPPGGLFSAPVSSMYTFDGGGTLQGRPVEEQLSPAYPYLGAIYLFTSNLIASSIQGASIQSTTFSNATAICGQTFCSSTDEPTNTYYGFTSKTTNIVCMGSNADNTTGYLLLAYSNNWPHLKIGDQFNVEYNGNYNEQWWILDVTNNPFGMGANVDAVCCYNLGSVHNYPAWTNVFVSPAAHAFTDDGGHPGSYIGGDGGLLIVGERGSWHNSGRFVLGDGYWSFMTDVNSDNNGCFATICSVLGGNYAGLKIGWNAPQGSLAILPNTGNVSIPNALLGPGQIAKSAQTSSISLGHIISRPHPKF